MGKTVSRGKKAQPRSLENWGSDLRGEVSGDGLRQSAGSVPARYGTSFTGSCHANSTAGFDVAAYKGRTIALVAVAEAAGQVRYPGSGSQMRSAKVTGGWYVATRCA
jgi:hypothetical protein